ncbi:DNA-binding protein [Frankia sp. CiP3]|uniref:DNA-binding protein n=1 Tax=Frankia sp. CiP3 TaxID=2880971 RepID=UPI001EF5B70E|nr:DNA-binding protein [Frankia sp. CiP3]
MTGRRLTFPELFDLPTVVDLTTAARAVGVSINTAYKLVHAQQFPCPVMRLGWRYQVSTAGLLHALGIDESRVCLDDVQRGASFARSIT